MTKQAHINNKGFDGHLISQACGAINDNFFRNTFGFLAAASALSIFGLKPAPALGLCFMLGMLLCKPIGGYFADRLPMHHYIRMLRCSEAFLVLLGIGALSLGSLPLMLGSLFLLGAQSGLYGPVKYAIIPLLVDDKDLEKANGYIQAFTTASILTGIILTAVLDPAIIAQGPLNALSPLSIMAALALGIAALGIISSFRITALPAQNPTVRMKDMWTWGTYNDVLNQGYRLRQVIAGIASVWFLAAVLIAILPAVSTDLYGFTQSQFSLMNACLLVGTAASSLLAPRLHTRAHPGGLPCLGAVILCIGLYFVASACATAEFNHSAVTLSELYAHSSVATFMWGLTICGFGFGFVLVPLNTILQQRSSAGHRGQLFAVCGIIGSLATLAGFASSMVAGIFFHDAITLYLFFGLCCVITCICACAYRHQLAVLPIIWLQRFCYKVSVSGEENIPTEGGCLIVCNHMSYSDGIILGSNLPRHAKFLVYDTFTKIPVLGFFLRALGVIAIDGQGKRQALVSSINAAVEAAKAGEAVVIFPEGKLSRSGQIHSFQRGMERIAQRAGVPVIPVHLDGLFGTVSSRADHKKIIRPRRPVRLRIGKALPQTVSASEARSAILHLQYQEALSESFADTRTLGCAFLQAARRHPFKTAIFEASGTISYLKAAACARAMIEKFQFGKDDCRVGILLPPGRAGAMVNIALAIDARCAVNLNHTVGESNLNHMFETAELKTLITSKLYIRHLKIDADNLPARIVYIEDILKSLNPVSTFWKMFQNIALPSSWLCRGHADDVAAIIFSSGSTGTPKAVQLTHRNFIANGIAAYSHLELDPKHACILCPLPLFHSFGLGVGIWLPLANGLSCALQADPRDGAAISALCAASQATILVSTPTFVRSYMRRMKSEELVSLRIAVVGAEKCPADLRDQFKEKFAADVLEGYGCTELCPFVASNISDTKKDGLIEKGSREGSIGRAIPGLELFTIDIDSKERLPIGESGLLIVRSPALMKGYLGQDNLNAEVFIHDGYNTGDIVHIDEAGFIFITGRLARFAKIAGEMVPLDNVQEAIQAYVSEHHADSDTHIAVAAIADPARGERLIVMHTNSTCSAEDMLSALDEFPAIFKPKSKDIKEVESIPVLGTGKMDLQGIKKLAEDLDQKE